jgi:hypothetical protein
MLIVMNVFSFCVEFEILLHFLLDYKLWSVNEDINMRNELWSEIDRTYTKKSSENHFLDKNYGPQLLKLWTTILGLVHPITKWQEM